MKMPAEIIALYAEGITHHSPGSLAHPGSDRHPIVIYPEGVAQRRRLHHHGKRRRLPLPKPSVPKDHPPMPRSRLFWLGLALLILSTLLFLAYHLWWYPPTPSAAASTASRWE